ncbi:acyltransferase family protein [Priestia megaterium]|uniref:acyltransferase family protein n=1 Tax=Priestia megaterium TaxID=1404 RepID=UPI001EDC8D36|nr:acyltransferase family protein [Priestia megaterium]UKJ81776.1 acyltransferase family protein [Priestia megaterium]
MKRKPVKEIFLIRSIACLAIVLLHSIEASLKFYSPQGGLENNTKVWYETFALILKFGTPVFVLISIFLLAYSYPKKTPSGFIKKRIKFILIPYLVMAVFYALLDAYIQHLTVTLFLKQLFMNIFLGGYHGYFILIIFQFYLLYMLFQKYAHRFKAWYVIIICFIINFIYLGIFNFTKPIDIPHAEYIWTRFSWVPFLGWLFYFSIAYYFGIHYEAFKKFLLKYNKYVIAFAILSCALVVFLYQSNLLIVHSSKRIDMLLFSTAMFLLLYYVGAKLKSIPSFFSIISQYSFGIYLLHLFYIALINKFIEHLPFLGLSMYICILLIGSTILSMISTHLLNMIPLGHYVVGKIGIKDKDKIKLQKAV